MRVFFLVLLPVSFAAVLWVSPFGSNSNSGTSPTTPVLTLSYAYSLLTDTNPKGINDIVIEDGVYTVDTNALTLQPMNTVFFSPTGNVELTCNGSPGPFVQWGGPPILDNYFILFNNVKFVNCSSAAVNITGVTESVHAYDSTIEFAFDSVTFTDAPLWISCLGDPASGYPCNLVLLQSELVSSDQAVMQGQVSNGVYAAQLTMFIISSTKFGKLNAALQVTNVNILNLNDTLILSCTTSSAVVTLNTVYNLVILNSQLVGNSDSLASGSTPTALLAMQSCFGGSVTGLQIMNNNFGGDVWMAVESGSLQIFELVAQGNTGNSIIYASSKTTLEISGGLVSNNTAVFAVVVLDAAATFGMGHGQINDNLSTHNGTIAALGDSFIDLYMTIVNGNTALGFGGAMYAVGSRVFTDSCSITNNVAQTGGAIYCVQSALDAGDGLSVFYNNLSLDGSNSVQCGSQLDQSQLQTPMPNVTQVTTVE